MPSQSTLMYPVTGKVMRLTPINWDGMEHLIIQLERGQSCVVQLEPGDATHYCLLLTPCWAMGVRQELGRFGIPVESATNYMLVTALTDEGSDGSTWITPHVMEYQVAKLSPNPWSQLIYLTFLQNLWWEIGQWRDAQ
jgi:hypothetical protein